MPVGSELPVAALQTLTGDIMALKSVKASGRVSGLLFELTVRQVYRNDTQQALETVYTFPLAWGAVLLGLNVEIAGARLSGVVLEKKEAERRYEDAIADGDSPIMLEKSADGLYTVNLGNLKPGEEAVIEYRYAQVLRFEQGHVRVTVPTTIAPRYGDAEGQGGIRPHEAVASDLLVEYPFELSLTLDGDLARGVIQSPSHQISTCCESGRTLVSLSRNAWLDRDFVLTVDGLEGRSLASVVRDGDQSVVMASFCPEIAGSSRKAVALKILVDCSGSMGGDSMQAAKQALHRVLTELEPADRISYSCFGSTVRHLIDRLVSANDQGIAKAAQCIEHTDAVMGGTEIQGALRSVFGLQGGEESTDVLLITDGEVWDTEETIEAARQSGHRIFAVGVGSAPAETMLRRLAEETGGACELVAPNEDIEAAIVRTFRRIRLPRATNLQVEWPEPPKWATPLPRALFGGETLHAFAAFDSPLSAPPVLSFETAEASRIKCPSPVPSPAEGDALVRLAGSERLKCEAGSIARDLALQYQLVTSQTSLFLVHVRESGEKATDLPYLQKITHMHAAGWGGLGVAASMPRQMMPAGSVMYSMGFDDLDMTISASSMDAFDIPAFLRTDKDIIRETLDQAHLQNVLVWMLVTVTSELLHPDRLAYLLDELEAQPRMGDLLAVVAAVQSRGFSRQEAWALFILWSEQQVDEALRLSRHAARAIRSATVAIPEERIREIFDLITEHMENLSVDGWPRPQYSGASNV